MGLNKEEMIEYILANPDSGLTIYTREELEEMDYAAVWLIWLRR